MGLLENNFYLCEVILEYGIEEDENLTEDAINLKKKINRYLKYNNG